MHQQASKTVESTSRGPKHACIALQPHCVAATTCARAYATAAPVVAQRSSSKHPSCGARALAAATTSHAVSCSAKDVARSHHRAAMAGEHYMQHTSSDNSTVSAARVSAADAAACNHLALLSCSH
jgi:hypothetical protein